MEIKKGVAESLSPIVCVCACNCSASRSDVCPTFPRSSFYYLALGHCDSNSKVAKTLKVHGFVLGRLSLFYLSNEIFNVHPTISLTMEYFFCSHRRYFHPTWWIHSNWLWLIGRETVMVSNSWHRIDSVYCRVTCCWRDTKVFVSVGTVGIVY